MKTKKRRALGKRAILWLLRALLCFILLFVVAAVLLPVFPAVGIVLILLAALFAFIAGIMIPASLKQYHILPSEKGVYLRRGLIVRRLSFVPYRAVVTHAVRGTPLSRFLGVFTIVLHLHGSRIVLYTIPKEDMTQIVSHLKRYSI